MKCPICKHGYTRPGTATVTLERGASTIIFRQVPAEICDNCGEVFHSADVAEALLAQAEVAVAQGVEIDRIALAMDLTAVHANDTPLDLVRLLEAEAFSFMRDVRGISQHINRNTGKLMGHFVPRHTLKQ